MRAPGEHPSPQGTPVHRRRSLLRLLDAFDDCESLETILVPAGTLDRFLTLLPKSLHEFIEEL